MPATVLPVPAFVANRWSQLVIGIVCMSMIANLQYGWTLFVGPLDAKYHWGRASIQVAFSIFTFAETWLVPIDGWFVDRYGPRVVTLASGVLIGLSWAMNAFAASLPLLYLAAALGGIGAGAIYGTCIANALKWFSGNRGLATGLTSMGFGLGALVTILPIASMIGAQGYETAFLAFGLGQGLVVIVFALFLMPPPTVLPAPASRNLQQSRRDFTPVEMARTPLFWVMYVMFVLITSGGTVVLAQLAPIAQDYKVAAVPVSLLGITLPALTFALTLDRITSGVSRPFFGWVSDHVGRENTMFVAFALEAAAIWWMSRSNHDAVSFVLLNGLVFFASGEIYSLFPALCADAFGRKYAATNSGLLYTAKGTASALVPLASLLAAWTGSWDAVFLAAAGLNGISAVMALVLLKPLYAAHNNAASRRIDARPVPET